MIDAIIVVGFMAYAVTTGWRARRRAAAGLDAYFLAGKDVTGWKAGLSMAATQYAADTPLLVTGLLATGGVYLMWHFWIYGFGYLLLAFFFAEGWRRSGVLTDAELTEVRYSGRGVLALRTLKAIYYGTVVNGFFLAMVLLAAVRIAEVFLPWHQWLPVSLYGGLLGTIDALGLAVFTSATGLDAVTASTNGLLSIVLIVAFVYAYATSGGLRGVIATDVAQFVLMMVGTIAYAVLVMREVGGFGALGERMTALYGEAQAGDMLAVLPRGEGLLFPFLMLIGLQGLFWIGSDGTGYLAQRAMACRTDREARVAGVVFSWAQILVRSVVWLIIGVGLLVLMPFDPAMAGTDGFAASRELTFVTGIDAYLPVGLRGIMLAALLAALASTIDTHLNWGGSYWTKDLYERLYCQAIRKQTPNPRTLVRVARLSNLVIVVLALTIMVNLGSIQSTWFLSLVFGAGIGGVLMLRWWWHRLNLYGEAAALFVSLLAAPFVIQGIEAEWIRLGVMVLLGTGAAVIVSLITPRTDAAVLATFIERLRPLGWWPSPGSGHQFLGRLGRTCAASASLFLVLLACTEMVVQASDLSIGGLALQFLLAAALVPVWWPLVRQAVR
ncbi:MAG: Na+:solute symporter [Rhodothermales bacterium]